MKPIYRVKEYSSTARPNLKYVVRAKVAGQWVRKFYELKKDAESFASLKNIEAMNQGTESINFSTALRVDAQKAAAILAPFGKSLVEAAERLAKQLTVEARSCTVKELISELLRVKTADGVSKRYIEDLKSRLNHFAAGREERTVASISGTEIDQWLRALSVAASTRNNFRRVLIVAFSFALKRGYCITNPAETSEKAKEIQTAPGILKPGQLASLLAKADESLLPFIAIGAFAGLRRAELERLDWSEVDLQSGYIEVTAHKAKSARRRLVKIRENLSAWLQPYAKHTGQVAPVGCRTLIEEARTAAGIKAWPSNALRHSFASYHLARFKDSAALALEMGHTDSMIVFNHYRELVKPKEAARYWQIKPSADAGAKVVSFAAA